VLTLWVDVFLRALRYTSKQASLGSSDSIAALSRATLESLPQQLPALPEPGKGMIRADVVDTAITFPQLVSATQVSADFTAPIFDTVLLDARQALDQADFRRSILFASMAVEIMASSTLDDAHDHAASAGTFSGWHIVASPTSEDPTRRADPVFRFLRRRGDFAQLMHEAPLYALQRSLFVENPQLYQLALTGC